MSLTMNFEADSRLKKSQILSALIVCGVTEIKENGEVITGNFPLSNMYFVFKEKCDPHSVVAEGIPYPIDWLTQSSMTFHLVTAHYDECSLQLHLFLEKLAELSAAYFVLSFQFEGVHAIRDENGLQFLQRF